MQPRPLAPFATWPVHYFDEQTKLFVWFIPPRGYVIQYLDEVFGLEGAQRVVDVVNGLRRTRGHEVVAAGGFVSVHDMRLVAKVTPEARDLLDREWLSLKPEEFLATYIVNDLTKASLFARIAFTALNVRSTFRVRMVMKMLQSVEQALELSGFSAPLPGFVPGTNEPV